MEHRVYIPKAFHVHKVHEIFQVLSKSDTTTSSAYFSERCEELITWKCNFESHRDHLNDIDYSYADELFEKHVQEI